MNKKFCIFIGIFAAGISSKNIEDKTTAYSLIFPNIFTRYGLSQLDLSKVHILININLFRRVICY